MADHDRPQSAVSQVGRPASSNSRLAWGDEKGGYDKTGYAGQMEDEKYDGAIQPAPNYDTPAQVEQKDGCWNKFARGIRSLWATRQTEDTDKDRELHVKTTLRELVIYIVFLIVLCVVTFGMTSPTMYYYTKVMSELFLDAQYPDTKNTYRGSTQITDFWRFVDGPLLDGLYWETWYNDQDVAEDELGFIFYENKLLGVPRVRMLNVRHDSCSVADDFKDEIHFCYNVYKTESESHVDLPGQLNLASAPPDMTAYKYKSEAQLDGSSHQGYLGKYAGGGYVQNLARRRNESELISQDLHANRWIDRGTRAIFIDFTVYNANINLFCVIRLLMEFPATGGMIPSWTFRTVKLIRYVTVSDYFVMACECIFCLFIFYYTVEEILEIKRHRWSYFRSFWNILDILVIIISVICICFNIYRSLAVTEKLNDLLDEPDDYPDFEFLSFWQTQFNSAIAITVFLAWVKVFKYISFNKTMTQLSSTLARCAKDLAGFAVMFFIVFLAFAQLGYLIFGTQVKDFSTFDNAVFTLFRIILGDFNFHELEAANRVLGPIYFILYVFFVFFVLLNMFLAIINDTYSEVKADIASQKNEFEMTDYFKKGYNKMLEKMNLKKDKIVDIQKALKHADINKDNKLDFEEWRIDLKSRGYAEQEIEAVFAKYDIDGDRVLNEDEQRRMQLDLEVQKQAIDHSLEDGGKGMLDDEDDDEEEEGSSKGMGGGGSASGGNGVSYEEFTVLSRRVDRMEHSIGSIVSKIDAVLVKLEAMERAKSKRRETMSKILDSISEADGNSDEVKREKMEALVRQELERWDDDSGRTSSARSRSRQGTSPSASGATGGTSEV